MNPTTIEYEKKGNVAYVRAMCAVAIFQNFTAIQKPIGDMKSLDLADKPAQPFI